VLQGLLWRPGRLLFNVLFSYRAHGLENLPQDRPYLIAANYTSHLDPPSILLALRSHVDCVTLAVGRSYFSRSVLSGWFLRTFANALALDHGENFRQSLIEIRSLLETRRPLLVFPEGMRSPSGQLQPFKTGVGLLALELDLPIVPVHVHGSFQARARGRRSRRPLIRLRFGQPLEMEPYRDRCGSLHRYEIYRLIVEELKRRIDALARRNGD
jgi:long-chain acyl-CoA synthetase